MSHLTVHKILELHYLVFLFGNLIMLDEQTPDLSTFDHRRDILLFVLLLQVVQLDLDFMSLGNGSNKASRKGRVDCRELSRIFQVNKLNSGFLAFTGPSVTLVWIATRIG